MAVFFPDDFELCVELCVELAVVGRLFPLAPLTVPDLVFDGTALPVCLVVGACAPEVPAVCLGACAVDPAAVGVVTFCFRGLLLLTHSGSFNGLAGTKRIVMQAQVKCQSNTSIIHYLGVRPKVVALTLSVPACI